jgi:hypothetical protein
LSTDGCKKCPQCVSIYVKKNGKKSGIQRYKCRECNKNFSSIRRPEKLEKSIFKDYIYKRQTLKDLAQKYNRSIRWVQYKIKEYEPYEKIHSPRAINLICDATFYGKRKDKLGTLVFMDSLSHEILLWKHIETEKATDYKQLLLQLISLGYTINSVTVDGKKGLYKVFEGYPIQMCHFHQKRTTRRYLTNKPKLDASKDLKIIASKLKYSDEVRFKKALDIWYLKYKNFIDETTINNETGKVFYTHQRTRSAYRSLVSNLPYLFTHKKHKNLSIHNTTNLIEGGVFSSLKILIKIHRGLSKSLKLKIVDEYLVSYKKK